MSLLRCFDSHGCDKGSSRHRYDRVYEPIFGPRRNEQLRILEIGIFRGASVAAWLDYFPNAEVIAVDTFQRIDPNRVPVLANPRVSWWRCDSTQRTPKVSEVDFVIDDGSHDPTAQLATFNLYRGLVRPGGIYFIEDVKRPEDLLGWIGNAEVHQGAAGEYLIEIK